MGEGPFFLFLFQTWYPRGGAEDSYGIFPTIEAAKTHADTLLNEYLQHGQIAVIRNDT